MALQVPSGLITSISGGGLVSGTTLPLFSYPIPMVIVGANGASASGNHSITDSSGALNVNIVAGSIASVSGDSVVVSSGNVAVVSGEVHVMSGIVGVASGVVSLMSGNAQIFGSGYAAFTMLSGNVGVSGQVISGAWLQPVVLTVFDYSGLGYVPIGTLGSGVQKMSVSIGIANSTATNANVGSPADATGGQASLFTTSQNTIFNGTNWDRARTVTGSSGGSLGVLATQPVGYSYTLFSGAAIVNVKSGALFLHAININSYSSGGQVEIRDSVSGVAGLVLGTISPTIGTIANTDLPPASLLYDALLTSGLVLSSSGALWNLTVLWRSATS